MKFHPALSLAMVLGITLGAPSVATAAPADPYANSIERIKLSMQSYPMKRLVNKNAAALKRLARHKGTTYAFQRDIFVCEQIYQPIHSPKHARYFEDPTAHALSACINKTIVSHRMYL